MAVTSLLDVPPSSRASPLLQTLVSFMTLRERACSRRRFNRRSKSSPEASSAVALLEFLAVAAWARIVAADVFQGIAHRFLVSVAAVRTVDMAVVVIMVVMVMIVVAVRAVDVGLLGHRCCSGIRSAAIITPLRARCT